MQPSTGLIFQVLRAGGELPLNITQKMVLLVLLNHWNPKSFGTVVWPSQPRIADHARITERAARSALAGLEKLGLIKTVRQSGKSNRYQLSTGAIESLVTPEGGSGVPRQNQHKPRNEVPGTPERRSSECPSECPTNALGHSDEPPRQGEMRMLGDVARNALKDKSA